MKNDRRQTATTDRPRKKALRLEGGEEKTMGDETNLAKAISAQAEELKRSFESGECSINDIRQLIGAQALASASASERFVTQE